VVARDTAAGARLTLVMSLARCQPTLQIRRRKNDNVERKGRFDSLQEQRFYVLHRVHTDPGVYMSLYPFAKG
jgi:hypothetical protein